MRKLLFILLIMTILYSCSSESGKDYPFRPVPFTDVQITDNFWYPRLDTNRKVTIPFDFQKCEETSRISNFAVAGELEDGEFVGIKYNDSDVFKVIEGASYSLATHPDPKLEKYLDDLIFKIAAAQEDDGYLFTTRTIDPENPKASKGRWSNLKDDHELYNVGHMYEAAAAYYQATGKRSLLDVALKNAELINSIFGPDINHGVPGHEEIEIGLTKLYRVTGDKKYLYLAKFFLDERGNSQNHELYGIYYQDHMPVIEQEEAVGHAVRAGYMYSGMADVAALTNDQNYIRAISRIWENVVSKKLYLTGGIGARHGGESFGDNYELPNASAYNETCAAIANMMWNHRLFLLYGESKYIDVLERTLYNGFLSGISLEGDKFFYPNPLESDGIYKFNIRQAATRYPWFNTSCCPTNVVRFLPSLPGYIYAYIKEQIFINLYIGSTTELTINNTEVKIKQETSYPWEGLVKITVDPAEKNNFTLNLRIPGWAQNKPVPSDLYSYLNEQTEEIDLRINGEKSELNLKNGYAEISRTWKKGDIIELNFPLSVKKVISHQNVEENKGKLALERGPLVYCAEGIDNDGKVLNLMLDKDSPLKTEYKENLLNGIITLKSRALSLKYAEDGNILKTEQEFVAIPYYVWSHRGEGEMAVWLPYEESASKPTKQPTIASYAAISASFIRDELTALNDQVEPKSSNDHTIRRFTWWNHLGTQEWVQYDFKKKQKFSSMKVYWFDDTGIGQCRIPKSWRLLYQSGGEWPEVPDPDIYGIKKDQFNELAFTQIETSSLRLVVKLQPEFSGGSLNGRLNNPNRILQ